jgi:hypothetical protein
LESAVSDGEAAGKHTKGSHDGEGKERKKKESRLAEIFEKLTHLPAVEHDSQDAKKWYQDAREENA